MDTALVVITLLSVGLSCGLVVYASRLQRRQRARADVRVAAGGAMREGEAPSAASPRVESALFDRRTPSARAE